MNASLPPPGIHLRGVDLDRGGPLFRDLALDLDAGAWSCLLGASGVGKTSLLRLLAGLARPTRGEITASDGLALAGRVAYMAQQDLLLPWLSVLENVRLGPRLRGEGRRAREPEARAMLARVGLADHARRLPATLSGGERQRVALARTLLEERPVVLMDEPFAALDALTRHRLQALAAGLLVDRTVLLVTHDPLEALRLGHRVLVLTGQPASPDAPLLPPGQPPRAPDDPALTTLHRQLLAALGVVR